MKTITRLSVDPMKSATRQSHEQINLNKVNLQINPNPNILSLIRGNTSNGRERPTAFKQKNDLINRMKNKKRASMEPLNNHRWAGNQH